MTGPRFLAIGVFYPLLAAGGGMSQPPAGTGDDGAVRRDTAPPLLSLYLPIRMTVPGVADPATGVFVPKDYRVGLTVDLLVFLRGYDIRRPKAATSVAEYWNSPEQRRRGQRPAPTRQGAVAWRAASAGGDRRKRSPEAKKWHLPALPRHS